MPSDVTVQSLGNEGFCIDGCQGKVYVDAFYHWVPGVAGRPVRQARDAAAADLILVTHAHHDHFDSSAVAAVARRTGAVVVGPSTVTGALERSVPAGQLLCLEPPPAQGRRSAPSRAARLPGADVTAFRTFHGGVHNSYLIETSGVRIFHDGDNEDTRPIDASVLAALDVLMIAPWRGSGWPEFIEGLAARHVLLMHLTEQELDEHDRGAYLPSLCDRPPEGAVGLRPGQSLRIAPRTDRPREPHPLR